MTCVSMGNPHCVIFQKEDVDDLDLTRIGPTVSYTHLDVYKRQRYDFMDTTMSEVVQFIQENDVKFIRLAFCDIFGNQKNIAIMPTELRCV